MARKGERSQDSELLSDSLSDTGFNINGCREGGSLDSSQSTLG